LSQRPDFLSGCGASLPEAFTTMASNGDGCLSLFELGRSKAPAVIDWAGSKT